MEPQCLDASIGALCRLVLVRRRFRLGAMADAAERCKYGPPSPLGGYWRSMVVYTGTGSKIHHETLPC